jgi:hypothetical protein
MVGFWKAPTCPALGRDRGRRQGLRNSKFGAIKHGPQKILFISPFLTFLIEKKISSPKKVSKEVFGDNFL